VRKSEGKSSSAVYKRICEDNIKIYLQTLGLKDVDWIDLTRDSKGLAAVVIIGMEISLT
jgi:hypothetical protein